MELKDFLIFICKNGLDSLYLPIEGSAILLYIPIFFYVTILISCIFQKIIFRETSKKIFVIYVLIILGLLMFLESVSFYSPLFIKLFPSISASARGVLRSHLNLIPFVNLLAGFTCFAAISELKNMRLKVGIFALIITVSFAIDGLLFLHKSGYDLKFLYFESSNLVHVNFSRDIWHFLPWINVSFIIVILIYNFVKNTRANVKKFLYPILIILTVLLPLLSISMYNELNLQLGENRMLIRDSYMWESYLNRKKDIDNLVNRYDPNYRTLYTGVEIWPNIARSWKSIAETEMHPESKEKVLFSYREFEHPYVVLIRGAFNPLIPEYGRWYGTNIMPPPARQIAYSIDNIKLMGVKWIISADEEIKNEDLIYRGKVYTPPGPMEKAGLCPYESGTTYIYELKEPRKIVFVIDNYKIADFKEAVQCIIDNKKYPWNNNMVYIEENPESIDKKQEANMIGSKKFEENAQIVRETFNSIDVNVNTSTEKFLVLSYIYRPNWKAYIDKTKLKIYRAYGGFMCVKVLPGEHVVKFRYYPKDVYLGFVLTVIAFVLPFGIIKIF